MVIIPTKRRDNMNFKRKHTKCAGMAVLTAVFALALLGCPQVPEDTEPTIYKVTFDANGGTFGDGSETKEVEVESGKKATLPANPTITGGQTFWGWFPGQNGPNYGTEFTENTLVTGNTTVYARWGTGTPVRYTVTFNGNGGTVTGTSTANVIENGTVTPPSATRSGYSFNGWNTNSGGTGTPFTASTPVTQDITVFAQWTQNAGPVTPPTPGNGSFTTINGADVYEYGWNDLTGYTLTKVTGSSYNGSYAYTYGGYDDVTGEPNFVPFTDFLSSATVNINNGKLTVNLGTPMAQYLNSIEDMMEDARTLSISNRNAKMFTLYSFCNQDGISLDYESSDNSYIMLCYVNTNVTITGIVTEYDKGDTYTQIYALNLRQGWNYVITSWTGSGGSYLTAQPGSNAKWVLGGGGGDEPMPQPTIPPANHTPLTNGQWANGEFTGSGSNLHWYSFTVTAGTTYYVWWNDEYEGDGSKQPPPKVVALMWASKRGPLVVRGLR
jgi:uncharacterized repeat protein (TIGR02543 family)